VAPLRMSAGMAEVEQLRGQLATTEAPRSRRAVYSNSARASDSRESTVGSSWSTQARA
jgi:hypothetical protein